VETEIPETFAEAVRNALQADAKKESWLLLKELMVILLLVFLIFVREAFFDA